MVLRDHTTSLVARHRKTTCEIPVSPTKIACKALQTPSLPRDITYSLESHALAFLFSSGDIVPARDTRASHGHLDFLHPLYQNVAPNSPLSLATSWLGVVVMGMYNRGKPYSLEGQLIGKVIESILAAVADPISSLKDETLMAVILVAYGEHWRERRYGTYQTSAIHQQGAESLIRQRGILNFNDGLSLALFDAVRHNAVGFAMSGSINLRNWDLWNVREDMRQLCDSYTPATELDGYGVTMVALKQQLKSKELGDGISLRESIFKLLEHLRSWQYRVPREWLPQLPACSMHSYPPPKICFLIDQWYLLQLGVLHLIRELHVKTNAAETAILQDMWEMECVDNIIASEYLILSSEQAQTDSRQSTYIDGNFPSVTVQHCADLLLGPRFFSQILDNLDLLLSSALEELNLSTQVAVRYREVITWARREQATLKEAFALVKS